MGRFGCRGDARYVERVLDVLWSRTWVAPVRGYVLGAFAWSCNVARVSESRRGALFRVAVREVVSLADEHVVYLSGGA